MIQWIYIYIYIYIYFFFFNSFGVSFREEKERIFLGYVFWDFREGERGGEGLKG